MKMRTRLQVTPQEKKTYVFNNCIDCGKAFGNRRDVENHEEQVHGDKKFQCDICKIGYRSQRILDNHKHVSHKTSYVCECCKTEFKNEKSYNTHLRSTCIYKDLQKQKSCLKSGNVNSSEEIKNAEDETVETPLTTESTVLSDVQRKSKKRVSFNLPNITRQLDIEVTEQPEMLQNDEQVNQSGHPVSTQMIDTEEKPEVDQAHEEADENPAILLTRRPVGRPKKKRRLIMPKSQSENQIVEPAVEPVVEPDAVPGVEFEMEAEVQPEVQLVEMPENPSEEQAEVRLEDTSNCQVVEETVEEALVDDNESPISENTAEQQVSTKRTVEDMEDESNENSTEMTTSDSVPVNDVPSPTGSNSSADHHTKNRKSKRVKKTHSNICFLKFCPTCKIGLTNKERYENHVKQHLEGSALNDIEAEPSETNSMEVVSDGESLEEVTQMSSEPVHEMIVEDASEESVETSRVASSLNFTPKSSDADDADDEMPDLPSGRALVDSPATADNAEGSTPLEENNDEIEFIPASSSVANSSFSSLEQSNTAKWTCNECPDVAFNTAIELQYHLFDHILPGHKECTSCTQSAAEAKKCISQLKSQYLEHISFGKDLGRQSSSSTASVSSFANQSATSLLKALLVDSKAATSSNTVTSPTAELTAVSSELSAKPAAVSSKSTASIAEPTAVPSTSTSEKESPKTETNVKEKPKTVEVSSAEDDDDVVLLLDTLEAKLVEDNKFYKCAVRGCKFSSACKIKMRKHRERRHPQSAIPPRQMYRCDNCNKGFYHMNVLLLHREVEGNCALVNLNCRWCGQVLPDENELREHHSAHVREDLKEAEKLEEEQKRARIRASRLAKALASTSASNCPLAPGTQGTPSTNRPKLTPQQQQANQKVTSAQVTPQMPPSQQNVSNPQNNLPPSRNTTQILVRVPSRIVTADASGSSLAAANPTSSKVLHTYSRNQPSQVWTPPSMAAQKLRKNVTSTENNVTASSSNTQQPNFTSPLSRAPNQQQTANASTYSSARVVPPSTYANLIQRINSNQLQSNQTPYNRNVQPPTGVPMTQQQQFTNSMARGPIQQQQQRLPPNSATFSGNSNIIAMAPQRPTQVSGQSVQQGQQPRFFLVRPGSQQPPSTVNHQIRVLPPNSQKVIGVNSTGGQTMNQGVAQVRNNLAFQFKNNRIVQQQQIFQQQQAEQQRLKFEQGQLYQQRLQERQQQQQQHSSTTNLTFNAQGQVQVVQQTSTLVIGPQQQLQSVSATRISLPATGFQPQQAQQNQVFSNQQAIRPQYVPRHSGAPRAMPSAHSVNGTLPNR